LEPLAFLEVPFVIPVEGVMPWAKTRPDVEARKSKAMAPIMILFIVSSVRNDGIKVTESPSLDGPALEKCCLPGGSG
jgi:hypothetical protein